MENDSQEKRKYTGKSKYGSYTFEYTDLTGKRHEGFTSESQEKYIKRISLKKIKNKFSNITIKYKGNEYSLDKLNKMYNELAETEEEEISDVPNISVEEELNESQKKELNNWRTKMAASSWKSRQRGLRKKGKLEKYKIESLNKLGMVWNPKEDEWEKNYLTFRTIGFCDELEDWVKEQRILFNNNDISSENLQRLNAIKFPFEPLENEDYKFTKKSIWKLIEKLNKKQTRLEREEKKRLGLFEEKKKNSKKKPTKKEIKEKESQKEVNSFYARKYNYCSDSFLRKLTEKETLDKLTEISEGNSIFRGRLKEFLDNESNRFKSEGKKTPYYVKNFYSEILDKTLNSDEIYGELSLFMTTKFNSTIRLKACQLMLKYISSRNLNNSKSFKEINYLISEYKKQKNITELKSLLKFINKYPLLFELYNDKIEKVLLKF
jgi:hypothetical protein